MLIAREGRKPPPPRCPRESRNESPIRYVQKHPLFLTPREKIFPKLRRTTEIAGQRSPRSVFARLYRREGLDFRSVDRRRAGWRAGVRHRSPIRTQSPVPGPAGRTGRMKPRAEAPRSLVRTAKPPRMGGVGELGRTTIKLVAGSAAPAAA